MASFILSRPFLVLLLTFTSLLSRISISEATSSFSFTSFDKNASFASDDIALYGHAKLVDGGASIQLTDSMSHIGGGVVYKKPIESKDTKDDYFTGFSTVFSFSMSPGRGRGGSVGFVVFPSNGSLEHSFFQVKFDISDNFTKFKDSNVTVGVYGSKVSEKITNLTVVNSKEEEEMLLYVWITYQANIRYVDASLTKPKDYKYPKTRFSSRIDLLKDEDEFMVGVKSYSGNFSLHSWRLQAGHFSRSIHSYAALLESKRRWEEEVEKRRREKMWGTVTCFVMTFGSIGLVFFAMMRIWAAFKRNYLAVVVPEECGHKTKAYEKMEKVEVVMSKAEVQHGK